MVLRGLILRNIVADLLDLIFLPDHGFLLIAVVEGLRQLLRVFLELLQMTFDRDASLLHALDLLNELLVEELLVLDRGSILSNFTRLHRCLK